MVRVELSSQFSDNDRNEYPNLSPGDRKLFVDRVAEAPAPDIDRANEILKTVRGSFREAFGMSAKNREDLIQRWETRLHTGKADDQAKASDKLMSIANNYSHAKEIFPGNRSIR